MKINLRTKRNLWKNWNKYPLYFVTMMNVSFGFAQTTTYYVDQTNGSDSNYGTSLSASFESFDAAEAVTDPGDTILIVGVYANDSYNREQTQ